MENWECFLYTGIQYAGLMEALYDEQRWIKWNLQGTGKFDIQNIKKETRYPSWTNMSDGQKPASSKDDCNTDNKNSKDNFMNQKNKNEVRMMENFTSKDKTGNWVGKK